MVTIFGANKGISQVAANRITRWSLYLSSFHYEIEYIKGSNNFFADMLSRLTIKDQSNFQEETKEEPSYLNCHVYQIKY